MKKLYKVKVTNVETKRVDIHENLSGFDLSWLKSMVTLEVEILEIREVSFEEYELMLKEKE